MNEQQELIDMASCDLRDGAAKQLFPGFDPAQSDLVTAE